MKEDALQKGLPVLDQAAVRERVLVKNVEAPDLATVKDFFRFYTATGKGKIVIKITSNSLIAVTELVFTGFTRITDIRINEDDRSEVYNVSIFHHLWPTLDLTLTSKSENPYPRKVKWFISRNQSIYYIRAASLISESSSCCISYPSNLASPSRPSYLQYYSLIHHNKAWPGKEEENSE